MASKKGSISKHRESKKHSLEYDKIWKGKKEVLTDDEVGSDSEYQDTFEYDPSTLVYEEAYNNEEFERKKKLTESVYEILSDNTNINFTAPRRKPSKDDFNKYYALLKNKLIQDGFTNTEIFVELSAYFSDKLFPIFKLLDNKWRKLIIDEIQAHIGDIPEESKNIETKNLTIGAEIEFEIYDDIDDDNKIITGVILEYDQHEEIYKVDSYENIYLVEISDIKSILNNRKFKYNLNKLNNIDFL